jgi:hypothetical protein
MRMQAYLSFVAVAVVVSSSVAFASDFDGTWATPKHNRQIKIANGVPKYYVFQNHMNGASNPVTSGKTIKFKVSDGSAVTMTLTGPKTAHGTWSGRGLHNEFDLTRQ